MQITGCNNQITKQNISFGCRADVNRLAVNYTTDLVDILKSKWNPMHDVLQLTGKYIPGVDVFQKTGLNDAYCAYKIDFDEAIGKFVINRQHVVVPKKFFLFFPFKGIRANFIGDIVHEVTHVFQNRDKDYSLVSLLNSGIGKRSTEYLKQLHSFAYYLFRNIETRTLAPIIFDNHFNDNTRVISNYTKFEKIISQLSVGLEKKLEQIINQSFTTEDGKLFKKDKKVILAFVKLLLGHEVDAYRRGNEAYKIALSTNNGNAMDFIPYLYKHALGIVNKIQGE